MLALWHMQSFHSTSSRLGFLSPLFSMQTLAEICRYAHAYMWINKTNFDSTGEPNDWLSARTQHYLRKPSRRKKEEVHSTKIKRERNKSNGASFCHFQISSKKQTVQKLRSEPQPSPGVVDPPTQTLTVHKLSSLDQTWWRCQAVCASHRVTAFGHQLIQIKTKKRYHLEIKSIIFQNCNSLWCKRQQPWWISHRTGKCIYKI